ncbi:MAG: hypothetical protein GY757_19190, partial [bacterium]|nr:hypothetical protein [bacterium]
PVSIVLSAPTISELNTHLEEQYPDAAALLEKNETKHHAGQNIEPVEKKEYYPLSSAQRRLYVLQQMDPHSIAYNLPMTMSFKNPIPRKKLETILKNLVARHESLRTSFVEIENEPLDHSGLGQANHSEPGSVNHSGPQSPQSPHRSYRPQSLGPVGPVQRIHDRVEFELKELPPVTGKKELMERIDSFIKPFDLSQPPLMRTGLIMCENGQQVWVADMHHSISDGVSSGILVNDFMKLYRDEKLIPLKIQYKDYTQWQSKTGESQQVKQQEKFWKKEFEGEVPVLNLPLDFARPAVQSFDGGALTFELAPTETTALKEIARENNVTLYMLLLTYYNIFLSKVAAQETIVIGTPTSGRGHADLEPVMGMFVNTLPLKNYPAAEKTFLQLLREIKKRTLDAFANQDYQYEDLVAQLAIARDARRNPLFDTMF